MKLRSVPSWLSLSLAFVCLVGGTVVLAQTQKPSESLSRSPSSGAQAPGEEPEELFDLLSPDEISSYLETNPVEVSSAEPTVVDEETSADMEFANTLAPKAVEVVVYSKNHALPNGPVLKEHLEVYFKGKKIHTWLVSTACNCVKTPASGKKFRPKTPRGTFAFQRGVRFETSRIFKNAVMNYALYVGFKPNSGIAIHATYGDHVPMLGTPASAGCIRLTEPHAKALFELVVDKVGIKNARVTIVDLQTKTGKLELTP